MLDGIPAGGVGKPRLLVLAWAGRTNCAHDAIWPHPGTSELPDALARCAGRQLRGRAAGVALPLAPHLPGASAPRWRWKGRGRRPGGTAITVLADSREQRLAARCNLQPKPDCSVRQGLRFDNRDPGYTHNGRTGAQGNRPARPPRNPSLHASSGAFPNDRGYFDRAHDAGTRGRCGASTSVPTRRPFPGRGGDSEPAEAASGGDGPHCARRDVARRVDGLDTELIRGAADEPGEARAGRRRCPEERRSAPDPVGRDADIVRRGVPTNVDARSRNRCHGEAGRGRRCDGVGPAASPPPPPPPLQAPVETVIGAIAERFPAASVASTPI